MKPSTLDAPLQIHCEGAEVLTIAALLVGEVTIYACVAGRPPQLIVRLTHVAAVSPTVYEVTQPAPLSGPLAEMAEEFAAEPEPKPRKRASKRSPAVHHGED